MADVNLSEGVGSEWQPKSDEEIRKLAKQVAKLTPDEFREMEEKSAKERRPSIAQIYQGRLQSLELAKNHLYSNPGNRLAEKFFETRVREVRDAINASSIGYIGEHMSPEVLFRLEKSANKFGLSFFNPREHNAKAGAPSQASHRIR